MERILVIIFLFLSVPYLGIPDKFDTYIVGALTLYLVYALYVFMHKDKEGQENIDKERIQTINHTLSADEDDDNVVLNSH